MSRLSGQSDGKRLLLKERKLNTSITVQDSSYPVVIAVHFKQNENSKGKKKNSSPELYSSTGMCDKGKGLEGDVGKKPEDKQRRSGRWFGGEKGKKKPQKTNQKQKPKLN